MAVHVYGHFDPEVVIGGSPDRITVLAGERYALADGFLHVQDSEFQLIATFRPHTWMYVVIAGTEAEVP